MTIESERGELDPWRLRIQRFLAGVGIAAATLAVTEPSAASNADSAAAQALFEQAKQLLKDGKAAEACPKLEESQRLDPGSGTLINLARCYEQTDRSASAWNTYLEAAAAAAASGNLQREKEARARAATLKPSLPALVIEVSAEAKAVTGLEITRDGKPVGSAQWGVPIPADAGEHRIAASAPGRESWQTVVIVRGPGGAFSATVPALAPAGSTAPPAAKTQPDALSTEPARGDGDGGLGTQRIIALTAGGVGVAGIVVGTIFGLKSMSDHGDAETYCDGSRCTDSRGVSAGNSAYSAGNVATVAMIVGGLGVATGVTLWFTAPKPAASMALAIGPAGLKLRGSF